MIKVAMIARSTLFTSRGGDTIQAIETSRMLRTHGILADIRLTNEIIQYENYHLLHFFNITRPADILYHIRKTSVPFVVSTILIDYSEYDSLHRKWPARFLFKHLAADSIEYVKSVARWIKRKDKIVSIPYFWKGQKGSINEIIGKASLLLPNSVSEYKKLKERYQCENDYLVVPNGVNTALFQSSGSLIKDPKLVLCVARIEGIKNQMNLIRALNNTEYKLVIVGAPSLNQKAYFDECRKMAAGNVYFIQHLPQASLVNYYRKAKVHVLPSWFETTGLSSLESAAMGCNIVVTDKGYTREYFGDHAVYCDPSSVNSIYSAVEKAASLPPDKILQSKIQSQYTWQRAGSITAAGYKRIINGTWD